MYNMTGARSYFLLVLYENLFLKCVIFSQIIVCNFFTFATGKERKKIV